MGDALMLRDVLDVYLKHYGKNIDVEFIKDLLAIPDAPAGQRYNPKKAYRSYYDKEVEE